MILSNRRLSQDIFLSVGLFLLTLVFFSICYRIYFYGGQTYEFCHYAEISSHVLDGDGYTTHIYFPSELAYLKNKGIEVGEKGPVLFRFPLYAVWCSIWMGIAKNPEFGMALANGTAHGAWVVILFFVSRKLFGSLVAWITSIIWMLHPMMLAGYNLSGYPDVFFGMLFLLFNSVWRDWVSKTASLDMKKSLILGFLAGLCFLARQSFIIWVPVFLFFFLKKVFSSRWKLLLTMAIGVFVTISPWCYYYFSNTKMFGTPLLTWELANDVVTHLSWLNPQIYSLSFLFHFESLGRLFEKWFVLFNRLIRDFPGFWMQPFFLPLCFLSFLKPQMKAHGFLKGMVFLLLWQVFVFSFLRYEDLDLLNGRYYLWFSPIVVMFAIGGLASLEGKKMKTVGLCLVFALHLQHSIFNYLSIQKKSDHSSGQLIKNWPEIIYLRDDLNAKGKILSNIPATVGWYAKCPSVNIPNHPKQLKDLAQLCHFDLIFLSTHRIGEPENYPAWLTPAGELRWEKSQWEEWGFVVEKKFEEGILLRRIT